MSLISDKIIKDLKLSPKRLKHTLGVAETAKELAKRHFPEIDTEKVEIAGLMHDFTKELPTEEQLALCEKYGITLSELERKNPKLLHAKTGAAIAREVYKLDGEVESAVYWHTTGKAAMSGMEICLYLADYIEPNRKDEGCVKLREYYYKKLGENNAETALIKTLIRSFDTTVGFLMEERRVISLDTIEARNYYVTRLETEKL